MAHAAEAPRFAPGRWRRLKPWLERALPLDATGRTALLDSMPGDDAELRHDLLALLRQQDEDHGVLDGDTGLAVAPLLAAALEAQTDGSERVGQRVGAFVLERLLGSGGMGAVYRARRDDGAFAQTVALKLLRAGFVGGDARARFERERGILAGLRHPNIAQCYDGGETAEGAPYLVMEYVEGEPITGHCRRALHTVEARVRLLAQAAGALAHAHQHLVIHRDIKPGNLLVTADGQAKLLDFGIAKLLGDEAGPTLTRDAFGPMTPEYAAPEQFHGAPVTVATDVYQFGVLMFRVLSGGRPYQADPDDTLAWARAVTEQEPMTLPRALDLAHAAPSAGDLASAWPGERNLARIRRQLAGDLDVIVHKALAKAPEQRYRTMDALQGDLEAWLAGEPIRARRQSAWYRARRFVARHRVAVAATATLAALLVVSAVFALVQAQRARLEAARATEAAERATAALHFVTDLFRAADPTAGGGEKPTVEAMVAQGAKSLRQDVARNPRLGAELAPVLGEIYLNLGDAAKAEPLYRDGIAALRGASSSDPLALASALDRGASAALAAGHTEQGMAWVAEAESLVTADTAETVDLRVNLMLSRATQERDKGDHLRAVTRLADALALSRRYDAGPDSARTALVMQRYGIVLRDLGRFAEGRRMLEGAVAAFRRLFGPDDLRALRAELALGWLLVGMDALDEAEANLTRSAERIRALVGERTQLYATCLYDQALLHLARKQPDAAQAAFRSAARIFVEAGGPASPQRGWALWNAAGIDYDRERWQDALTGFEQVLDAWRDTMPADAVVVGSIWDNIGNTHLHLGQLDEAVAASDRSLAILDRPERQGTQNLAEALQARGDIEAARGGDAESWYRRALEVGERAYPKDSPDLAALRERTSRTSRH